MFIWYEKRTGIYTLAPQPREEEELIRRLSGSLKSGEKIKYLRTLPYDPKGRTSYLEEHKGILLRAPDGTEFELWPGTSACVENLYYLEKTCRLISGGLLFIETGKTDGRGFPTLLMTMDFCKKCGLAVSNSESRTIKYTLFSLPGLMRKTAHDLFRKS